MNTWAVLVLAGISLGFQAPPGRIPDRVILEATFQGAEIGFDFVRFECMRRPNEESPRCWMDEVLVMGCDSGTAQIFPRHTPNEELKISGDLLKRRINVEIEGAGVQTAFRFDYFPVATGRSAYILTDAIMTQHDSVRKRDFEFWALKGIDATIKLPCAITVNGLWDRKELP